MLRIAPNYLTRFSSLPRSFVINWRMFSCEQCKEPVGQFSKLWLVDLDSQLMDCDNPQISPKHTLYIYYVHLLYHIYIYSTIYIYVSYMYIIIDNINDNITPTISNHLAFVKLLNLKSTPLGPSKPLRGQQVQDHLVPQPHNQDLPAACVLQAYYWTWVTSSHHFNGLIIRHDLGRVWFKIGYLKGHPESAIPRL